MGKLVVSENVSLDGVVEDPRGDEGLGRGDWFAHLTGADIREWAAVLAAEVRGAEAVLMGRGTFGYFAARYPDRDGELAKRLNGMPKYVVSATLDDPSAWQNTSLLSGDVVHEVATLKEKVDGEILVYASGHLVPTLVEHDLVDEIRLITYPLVVGAGERMFGATSGMKPMRLTGTRKVGDHLVHTTYEAVRGAAMP